MGAIISIRPEFAESRAIRTEQPWNGDRSVLNSLLHFHDPSLSQSRRDRFNDNHGSTTNRTRRL